MTEATDEKLKQYIERVENLEGEKKGIADDIKDVYAEMKSQGYDTKIVRMIVKMRKMNPDDRKYQEQMLDVYQAAVGLE